MRLITLGDSFSFGSWGWPELLSNDLNCELLNFAVRAAQNSVQVQLIQDWLIHNNFKKDDIVIWAIGLSWAPLVNISLDYLNEVNKHNEEIKKQYGVLHYHLRDNIIDNKQRISLLHISPIINDFSNIKELSDEPESLQLLLFMFIIIKKLCPKILIFRAKNDFVSNKEYWTNLTKHFKENNIEYIDNSIVDWCKDENLDFYPDNFHPTKQSMHIYTQKILYPKLKSLGWI